MAKSFIDAYLEAPEEIKLFLYSDDFYSFFSEYLKKFEIKDEIGFTYLLQDVVLKIIESDEELKEAIKSRLNLSEENSKQLVFHIKTKFIPLFEKLWEKEKILPKEEPKIKREVPKEVIDLFQKRREVSPQKVLNLKKVIPPKKETPVKKEEAVDLTNLQQTKRVIPKSTVDIQQTISWEPPKPQESSPSSVVIIKKEPKKKEETENIIDLSNL